jgi:lysophospholipase L1-like esterase
MQFRCRGVLVALLAALALLAPTVRGAKDEDPATATITLKKGDKIIFFGDSLTALAIKDRNVPEGKGYVPLVRAALKDKGVEVDAVATGGHRVPNLLARGQGRALQKADDRGHPDRRQ